MRACCQCGASFTPTGKSHRCPPCRRDYDRAWRAARKAAGKPASGSDTWDEDKRAAWKLTYYGRKDVRARKAEQMRGYAKAAETQEHHRARRAVRTAIEAGRLERQPCEVCGIGPAHAHHDDYRKPLDVRWLCPTHHREHHAKAEGAR